MKSFEQREDWLVKIVTEADKHNLDITKVYFEKWRNMYEQGLNAKEAVLQAKSELEGAV